MKETDFPTKNCRSAKKITPLRQVLQSNRTFVVEMYIYCSRRYFVNYFPSLAGKFSLLWRENGFTFSVITVKHLLDIMIQ